MKKSLTCILLAMCLVLGASAPLVTEAAPSKVTSESIRQKENQIKEAQRQKKELQGNLSDIKKIKQQLENEKSNLKNYVAKLDDNLSKMEETISGLKQEITAKETEIAATEEELADAEVVAQNQYDSMKARIRIMYESGTASSLWSLLMTAENLGDMLNRADYVNSLYEYDQKMWDEYLNNCEYIRLCKEELELEKDILNEQKKCVEDEQEKVESLIQEKKKQITTYESSISTKEQAIREYEQDIAEQNELIAQMEKAVAEEKKKLEAGQGNNITYDNGKFKFPLASYTRISDDYGYRTHPILGVKQFHNGVDFASPKGTAIYAAYDGIVVAADYSSSMGNYVMINHGDGLYTIYMHASALYVSRDAKVSKGDKIAAVGSTGRSTGNHLHFSVRLNGSYVSPWNYLSK